MTFKKQTTPNVKPPERTGYHVSWASAVLFFGMLFVVVGVPLIWLNWERMPARVRYLPRYIETEWRKHQPHPEFVPTPVLAALVQTPDAAPPTATPPTPPPPTPSAAHATPTPTWPPLPTHVMLSGVRHEYQRWNNCGPVTIGMALSFFGRPDTQDQTAPFLKPNPDDKNVSPEELAAYAERVGFVAHVGVAGDLPLLKRLLAAQFPVIIETWFLPEPDDGMGHYRLLIGYDDAEGVFIANDSYNGPNLRLPYAETDALWRVFNRTYVVVAPPERADALRAVLGPLSDSANMWAHSLAQAEAAVTAAPDDAFAWFNLGTSRLRTGDIAGAVEAYDRARVLGLPWRMLWYQFGPFEAYYAAGRYEDVLALADANLKTSNDLEESWYWRGMARTALGDIDGARADFERALRLRPTYHEAEQALQHVSTP
ncbi:tetratricopeptide repeat protein [Ardenticatena maritima]|nr:tetratricopeptide repeat protein [Ardenticatena maritima]